MTDQLTLAFNARDAGMARADSNADDWDRSVIDQAIITHLDTHGTVSANDFRDALPEIANRKLIGVRVNALRMTLRLVKAADETSTDEPTHGKPIGRWRRQTDAEQAAS